MPSTPVRVHQAAPVDETWPCPLCEDAYASQPAVRDHLAEDHGEDPDDFTLAPYAEAGR